MVCSVIGILRPTWFPPRDGARERRLVLTVVICTVVAPASQTRQFFHLAVGHPALRAQRVMLDASVADTVSSGIYTHEPVSAEEFFNDVRAVGRRILGYASTDYLKRYLTADLADLVCSSVASNRAVSQAGLCRAVWASAPSGAAATTVALGCSAQRTPLTPQTACTTLWPTVAVAA
ncbi:hypothetical protein DKM27_18770 [Mycobacterium tuberculosis variant bovis]|nr:hypothetical protein DKM27_18770 [Mycobacterium tuberculosis variant bovis]